MSLSQVGETLDHLFRRQAGQMVAYLTRFLGPNQLDLSEAVVQEALLKAAQTWPIQGIPDKPEAWIMRTAKNCAIDYIRKSRDLPHAADSLEPLINQELGSDEQENADEFADDQLKLMFICCHTVLSREVRVALTLKTLCGFSVKEIARAFLAKEETIAQRLVRAKQKISDMGLRYELPPNDELGVRIEAVLDALYLMFNEGYLATEGDSLIRRDLCEEAIYRTTALTNHKIGARPATFALLALMHFQVSRFNSRLDSNGELLLLEDQDRRTWDQHQIQMGLQYLNLAAQGEELSNFHLEAGIACCHAVAPSFHETDWPQVLEYYDFLLERHPSPIVALNRAVALAMVHGWDSGIEETASLERQLQTYHLLYATRAEFFRRKGDLVSAKYHFSKALSLAGTEPEKRLIRRRIQECEVGPANPGS